MTGSGRRIPVLVVLPPRALLLDLAGPVEVLRIAGAVQDRIAFDLRYAAPQGSIRSSIGLDLRGAGPLPPEIAPGTVVLLPGATEHPLGPARDHAADEAVEAEIVAWLRAAIRPGHTVVTVCEGALLAARAGLLDGYACTTHHGSCARLRVAAPRANVLENRLFVQDRDRFSSAGVAAGIDLMLHLVAEWAGPATAVVVARTLVVYTRRGPDDPQLSPWLEGRSHLHPVVHRAQDAIAAEPARDWSPVTLGKLAGASPRNLARLFRHHAGMTVTEAVNRARIARARDLIAQTDLGLEQVAERAGFASARHLRRVWAQFHATAPSVLRAKIQDSKGRDLSRVQGSALMGSGEARHRGSAPIPRQRAEPLETHDRKSLDPDDRL
ncbi:helix-turn-helix domain-containing protein [Methylobacterium sp. E-065]|uniref:GlxA family transcriptional regulator n=1 Tax=Methylobacterium sp. E-065 TaxID=2836583 RepID=UPI001FB8D202|nr:helix-turn-helix domain-containing protein [Methylobacterium sp. E-065]MCJ2017712.1 helix-turn-helix domain-containing protein [Methylobacterium sp. E-065]